MAIHSSRTHEAPTLGGAEAMRTRVLNLLGEGPWDLELFDPYPSFNPDSWAASLDWKGVNWGSAKAGVLIAPDVMLSSKHYSPTQDGEIEFVGSNGTTHARRMVAIRKPFGDLAVMRIDEDVPATVTVYPLPDPKGTIEDHQGALALYANSRRRAHVGEVGYVGLPPAASTYDLNSSDSIPWAEMNGGDSGSPMFLLASGNHMVLAGHIGFSNEAGPFYGNPVTQGRIAEAMKAMGSPHTFSFIPMAREPINSLP